MSAWIALVLKITKVINFKAQFRVKGSKLCHLLIERKRPQSMSNNLPNNQSIKLNASDLSAQALIVDYYQRIEHKRIFCIIDLNYTVMAINKGTMDIFGLYGDAFMGKNFLTDFNRSLTRFTFTSANLLNCLLNKRVIQFLSVNKIRKTGYETLLFEYTPLINKNTNNVVAILISAEVPLIPINFHNLKERLKLNSLDETSVEDRLDLSEREKEILFLLFHCNSRVEIAEIISKIHEKSITESAIRKLIQRNLYTKFNVVNDMELRNAIRNAGFHLKIPDAISDEFIFNVDDL